MNSACINFSVRVVIAAILTVALYGVWWIHNDHPFVAAGFIALGIVSYDWLLYYTRLLIWDELRILGSRQNRLLARLDEDEQQIEELTADEDDSPWG